MITLYVCSISATGGGTSSPILPSSEREALEFIFHAAVEVVILAHWQLPDAIWCGCVVLGQLATIAQY